MCYDEAMDTDLRIDVATLDPPHRRALEEVIGRELTVSQALIISVVDAQGSPPRPQQSLADWTSIYDGLSDSEIEAIDQVVKIRANLSRDLP